MKTVLFYQNKGANDEIFNSTVRDNCNDPFIYLKERINQLGYEVKLVNEYDRVSDCEAILFLTAPYIVHYGGLKGKIRWLKHLIFGKKNILVKTKFYDECVSKGMLNKMVLVLWEGQAVCPGNYNRYMHIQFNKILTWDDSFVDNKKFFKFFLPIARQEKIKQVVPFKNKKLLVNVSINKSSSFKRELYSERRETIEYFDKNFPNDFDLFGVGWNKDARDYDHEFACYRGPVKSKMAIMPKYKFALAYENLRGESGYVTEKIFDCLRAGTVPIYWGAPNINDYVDQESFIDRRKFKSNKELADFLIGISEGDYQTYLKAGEKYLGSEKFKLFLPEHFANTVIEILKLNA
ncbi:MAG: hypothetical protein A3J93_01150 [Candidatus Magasanikbacteria bacterium RIFOXYC2_FULL_42_28]|uniref:Fucosyltransferase C-terminal domain-containing protein n=1 Tax=Candidatus Magasanikbacteria bacterium RIFOXYC2_FULL_42_28 TaxID=1798704 RepID=A0A1F6NXP7_9BACT|nr:MAG: hypothetical protein A3J93_01150 [Candidatus Magasanikbacteria bacterium RIFOXYC2_FULL_42_28]